MDSGATNNFVNSKFVETHWLPTNEKEVPEHLIVADGRSIDSGLINKEINGDLIIKGVAIPSSFNVTNLSKVDAILGMPWFQQVNPRIDWRRRIVEFDIPESHDLKAEVSSSSPTKKELTVEELVPKKYHKF